ncbi:MAG: hypothetical protein GC179_08455 [Anaerolineaceae bacterium]|nr:hypothetical protein [Anaerolineaceae bacterium]
MTILILVGFTAASILFLVRSTLILLGYFKEPIIRVFSEYGPHEKLYMVGLGVLAWGGVLSFCGGLWAASYPKLSVTLTMLGIVMLLTVGLGYTYNEQAEKLHLKILRYPRWYHELRERTTRYERRRIGYMWLHLPLRARLSYNSSDTMFMLWADFVIMGTIREEEMDPRQEEHFYTGH